MRRFLLAVAVLALAASAAAEDTVIYPHSGPAAAQSPVAPRAGGAGTPLLVLALAAAGAGGWLLWRQRRSPSGFAGREARKLAVAESRALGNRQYLVVADYDGRKFLIGVCPGRIDLLAPLDGPAGAKAP